MQKICGSGISTHACLCLKHGTLQGGFEWWAMTESECDTACRDAGRRGRLSMHIEFRTRMGGLRETWVSNKTNFLLCKKERKTSSTFTNLSNLARLCNCMHMCTQFIRNISAQKFICKNPHTKYLQVSMHPSPITYSEFIIEFSFKIFVQHMHQFYIHALSENCQWKIFFS